MSDYHGEILKLKRVQRHQMGAYLCIASNTVPPSVSKRIRLNVNCKYISQIVNFTYIFSELTYWSREMVHYCQIVPYLVVP